MKKNLLTHRLFLISFSIVVSLALVFLLLGIKKLEDRFENEIIKIATEDIISITKNTADFIEQKLDHSQDYIATIENDPLLKQALDQQLSNLLTDNIKYAYLLYKDTNGVFRFAADGSKEEEKALFSQKFDVESGIYHQIFESKKSAFIQQQFLNQLSITYLTPIFYQQEVKLILAVDFSIVKTVDIKELISVVKTIAMSIIGIILLFTLILIIQAIQYFTVKKTAYTDKLTNVYNRNYLQEYEDRLNLEEFIIAAVDIDYFKSINDTYGHDVGDTILQKVAQTLLQSTRINDDIVIRYGGEEFIVLAKKNPNTHNSPLFIIERIYENIQKRKFTISQDKVINVTVSIGVNPRPEESRNFKEAFKLADIALYEAKSTGRNKIVIYNS